MKVAPYWKAVVAGLGAVAVATANVMSDGTVTTHEWVEIGVAALAAAGVYQVPNRIRS